MIKFTKFIIFCIISLLLSVSFVSAITTRYIDNVAEIRDGKVSYKINDRLGSQRFILDELGEVKFEFKSLPYGQTIINKNSKYGFTGKEQDASTGMHYFGARYYDMNTGRFIAVDPVVDNHPYSYVSNNPMNYVDPTGRDEEDIIFEEVTPDSCALVSAKLVNLETGQTLYEKNSDVVFHSMSTFKAALGTFYYLIVPEDKWADGAGDINQMLAWSNNQKTSTVFRRIQESLGSEKNVLEEFNNFLVENGLDNTYIQSWDFKFADETGYAPGSLGNKRLAWYGGKRRLGNKVTTSNDLVTFYSKLDNLKLFFMGKYITPTQKTELFKYLEKDLSSNAAKNHQGFSYELGPGMIFYSKTGSSGGIASIYSDAGIIISPSGQRYALSILATSNSYQGSKELFQNTAKSLKQYIH